MSYLKSASLAVMALAAGVLILGAAPASATVLCKVASASSCGAGNDYGAGTKISSHLKAGNRTLFTDEHGTERFDCNESMLNLVTTSTGGVGQTVTADVESASFGNCTFGTVPSISKKPSLVIHWISGSNHGSITETGMEITYGECVWGASGEQGMGTLTGGSPAVIDVSIQLEPKKGFCIGNLWWKGIYEVTAPSALYVTAS